MRTRSTVFGNGKMLATRTGRGSCKPMVWPLISIQVYGASPRRATNSGNDQIFGRFQSIADGFNQTAGKARRVWIMFAVSSVLFSCGVNGASDY
jgi:hypothetical protein